MNQVSSAGVSAGAAVRGGEGIMNPFTVIMVAFAMLGVIDRIIGNKFGLGVEFERGFHILGPTVLSMVGMIVLAPWLADVMQPVFAFMQSSLGMDPSILPAALFANDMGGASLCEAVAADPQIGKLNGLVVSAMMGCTVSFTIPYALEVVNKEQHRELLIGLLCGVMTVPFGCFAAGLMLNIALPALLMNLAPLIVFASLIAVGLLLCPDVCVKIFNIFGVTIRILITIGLALSILDYTLGIKLLPGLASFDEGMDICVSACVMLAGTFPLMHVVSRLLRRHMRRLGRKVGITEVSAIGLLGQLATCRTSFEMIKHMDKKGVVFNAAFSVSGAFLIGGHLAFTMAIDPTLVEEMIVGKLISGALALLVAEIVFKRIYSREKAEYSA